MGGAAGKDGRAPRLARGTPPPGPKLREDGRGTLTRVFTADARSNGRALEVTWPNQGSKSSPNLGLYIYREREKRYLRYQQPINSVIVQCESSGI